MKKQTLVCAVVTTMLGAAHGNACATQVKQDRSSKAWVFVPKGTCDKIAGGSTSAKEN